MPTAVTPFDAPEGSWTIAVFPDSQSLTRLDPDVFVRQAAWVAAHRQSHDIRFVIHLGDITDNNLPDQWRNAKKAMDVAEDAANAIVVAADAAEAIVTVGGTHTVPQSGPAGRAIAIVRVARWVAQAFRWVLAALRVRIFKA